MSIGDERIGQEIKALCAQEIEHFEHRIGRILTPDEANMAALFFAAGGVAFGKIFKIEELLGGEHESEKN